MANRRLFVRIFETNSQEKTSLNFLVMKGSLRRNSGLLMISSLSVPGLLVEIRFLE